jgi:hypothetical protein
VALVHKGVKHNLGQVNAGEKQGKTLALQVAPAYNANSACRECIQGQFLYLQR